MRTPWFATGAAAGAVFAMAAAFPLEGLARLTSWITLLIFIVVNASLLRIQSRSEGAGLRRLPAAVPLVGLVLSLGLADFRAAEVVRAIVR
jgi:amino acid transporter